MSRKAWNGFVAFAYSSLLWAAPVLGSGASWQVKVTPGFFNPTAGQTATFEVTGPDQPKGRLRIEVLDRDGAVIRELPSQDVASGWPLRIVWDGRDGAGQVVPNEAYTLRLTLGEGGQVTSVFDPSHDEHPVFEEPAERGYSVMSGVISYRLSRPSRVHIQVGQAVRGERAGKMNGPILKTVVDREPRIAGAVSEVWNGYDESGEVPVHTLPHLAMSIFATSLPDATVITVGSRGPAFREVAARRQGKVAPARSPHPAGSHHAGLTSQEDVSPVLALSIAGTKNGGVPVVNEALDLAVRLPKEAKSGFARSPAKMLVFVDERMMMETDPRDGMKIHLTVPDLAPGEHRVVVNWGTTVGPVGVGVARFRKQEAVTKRAER